ncbi:conserved hypothetical protein [Listeria seeligeri FSL S4-171]|nr:conserved hypothetical protein [Listeria seeligeri FSL S4-171]
MYETTFWKVASSPFLLLKKMCFTSCDFRWQVTFIISKKYFLCFHR